MYCSNLVNVCSTKSNFALLSGSDVTHDNTITQYELVCFTGCWGFVTPTRDFN